MTDWVSVFGAIAEKFDGAYNVVVLTAAGELVVARDPLGIRPLCYAQEGPLFAAASESVPLSNLGFKDIQVAGAGELVMATPKGIPIERFAPTPTPAHCFFEWIYFANVASTLDDRSVYLTRAALGRELAAAGGCAAETARSWCRCRTRRRPRRTRWPLSLRLPSVEGLDAQPLPGPHVHRGHG